MDGFENVLKGLGTRKDARTHVDFNAGRYIDQNIANNLYAYNWLCAKVIDIPVDDAIKKWRQLLISNPQKKEKIELMIKDFDVKNKVDILAKWGRVFGGAAIIAVLEGEDLASPLVVENIKPGSLKNFIVLDRYNIYNDVPVRNVLSENFGEPDYYTVTREGQLIHHSRLMKYNGVIPSIYEYERNNYWGLSFYSRLFEVISDSQITSQSINNLIYESNIDVYKINGLNELVAECKDDLVIKRLQIANEMKSVVNGIALDKEDEYDKKTNTFASLPEIDDRFFQKVAGASDIPVTRLLGISPTGMNATGESDMNNYYDNVKALQENKLRPILDWIDRIIVANAGYDFELKYEFLPLKQLSEKEKAEVELQRAQRDQIYESMDVIRQSDVMAQLEKDGTYVTIDEIRVVEEKEEEELFAEEN